MSAERRAGYLEGLAAARRAIEGLEQFSVPPADPSRPWRQVIEEAAGTGSEDPVGEAPGEDERLLRAVWEAAGGFPRAFPSNPGREPSVLALVSEVFNMASGRAGTIGTTVDTGFTPMDGEKA